MKVEGRLDVAEAQCEGLMNEIAEGGLQRGELRDFLEGRAHTVQSSTASLSEAAAARLGMNSCANTPEKVVPAMYCAMPR